MIRSLTFLDSSSYCLLCISSDVGFENLVLCHTVTPVTLFFFILLFLLLNIVLKMETEIMPSSFLAVEVLLQLLIYVVVCDVQREPVRIFDLRFSLTGPRINLLHVSILNLVSLNTPIFRCVMCCLPLVR